MKAKIWACLVAVCALGMSEQVLAAPVFFTGADLFNHPAASFPSADTTLVGTSLVFGPSAVQFEELVSLPVFEANELAGLGDVAVTFSANLTRLPCLQVLGDGCGPGDHDVSIGLGDGAVITATQFADNSNGFVTADKYTDLGTSGSRDDTTTLFVNAGYPAIGASYDVQVTFTVGAASTLVESTLFSTSGSASVTALDRTSVLEFHLMRDNGQGEQYQLNTLTIESDAPVVPLPATAWLFLTGLAALAGVASRKRRLAS